MHMPNNVSQSMDVMAFIWDPMIFFLT